MSIEYKLFTDIEDGPIKKVSLNIARLNYGDKYLNLLKQRSLDAFIRSEGGSFQSIIYFTTTPPLKKVQEDIQTAGTIVEERLRGKGIGTDMWLAFIDWAQRNGYKNIRTNGLNLDMESLFENLSKLDKNHRYTKDGTFLLPQMVIGLTKPF